MLERLLKEIERVGKAGGLSVPSAIGLVLLYLSLFSSLIIFLARKFHKPAAQPQQDLREQQQDDAEDAKEQKVDPLGIGLSKKDKKAWLKQQKKAARKEHNAAEEMQRKVKEEKRSKFIDKMKERAEEELLAEEEKLREMEQMEQERLKKLEEEYSKWKSSIAVESAGFQAEEEMKKAANIVTRFIEFVKRRRVVALEEIASEFNISAKSCAMRLEELLKGGQISGVLDDRGKFFFLTPEEIERIANYIEDRGRVSIAEVARFCNRTFDFNPVETDLNPSEDLMKELESKSD